jgi:hypothetical protein
VTIRKRMKSRKIALFVEGDSERGDARRSTLPVFFHRWLDPQLPDQSKVGITAEKFHGVSNYLDDLAQKVEIFLSDRGANFVIGLVDLYGLPPNRVDLSKCSSLQDKIATARATITRLVPEKYRNRFRQHFAVHEVEAWLLAYPDAWPAAVRDQILKRHPEQVNFNEPPAVFLKRILGGRYKKTVSAKNLFPTIDPKVAIEKCPNLKLLADDLLAIAKALQ